MINDFYFEMKDIVNPEDHDMNLYSNELTTKILNGAKTAVDIINHIETFNEGKRREKRLPYTIMVNGSTTPIFVAKAKVLEGGAWVVIYGYNKNGSALYSSGNNVIAEGVSTHMVKAENIVDVNFGSFDAEDCKFLIEKPKTSNGMSIINKLSEELSILNANISAGEYRNAIKQFCIFVTKNKLNSIDFDYESSAYSQYIKLCTKYITLVKNIVGHHDDPTLNVNDPMIHNKLYFFKNETERDEFLKIVENTRLNITDQNTFYDDDIEIFRKIISSK